MQIVLKLDWQNNEFEFQTVSQGKSSEMFDQQMKGGW